MIKYTLLTRINKSIMTITQNCRICKSDNLVNILSLGDHAMANSLKPSFDSKEVKESITLSYCQKCCVVQI